MRAQCRLRAAGASFEDRLDLLGHKSGRIMTHYNAPELTELIGVAEKVCEWCPATVLRVAPEETGQRTGEKAVL
jgi:hypothetical protein